MKSSAPSSLKSMWRRLVYYVLLVLNLDTHPDQLETLKMIDPFTLQIKDEKLESIFRERFYFETRVLYTAIIVIVGLANFAFVKFDLDLNYVVTNGISRGFYTSKFPNDLVLPLLLLFRGLFIVTTVTAVIYENIRCCCSKDSSDYSRRKMLARGIFTTLMFIEAVCGIDNMYNLFGDDPQDGYPLISTPIYEIGAWLIVYVGAAPVNLALAIGISIFVLVCLSLSYYPLIHDMGFVQSGAMTTILNYAIVLFVGMISSYARNRRKRIRFLETFGPSAVSRRKLTGACNTQLPQKDRTFAEKASILGPKLQKHVTLDYVQYVIFGQIEALYPKTPEMKMLKSLQDQHVKTGRRNSILLMSNNGIYRMPSSLKEAIRNSDPQIFNRRIAPMAKSQEVQEGEGENVTSPPDSSLQVVAKDAVSQESVHGESSAPIAVDSKRRRRCANARFEFFFKILCMYDSTEKEYSYAKFSLLSVVETSRTGFLTIVLATICFQIYTVISYPEVLRPDFRTEFISLNIIQLAFPLLLFVWFSFTEKRLQKRQTKGSLLHEYWITGAIHVIYITFMVLGFYVIHVRYCRVFSRNEYFTAVFRYRALNVLSFYPIMIGSSFAVNLFLAIFCVSGMILISLLSASDLSIVILDAICVLCLSIATTREIEFENRMFFEEQSNPLISIDAGENPDDDE